jgi:hypothetical protein
MREWLRICRFKTIFRAISASEPMSELQRMIAIKLAQYKILAFRESFGTLVTIVSTCGHNPTCQNQAEKTDKRTKLSINSIGPSHFYID